MLHRQQGLSLVAVAVVSVLLAGLAMVALWSMKHDHNYFADGMKKVSEAAPIEAAKQAVATVDKPSGPMKKCVIDGVTVISNTDCKDKNPTSKVIKIHDTKGFEAPKVPVAPKAEASADSTTDKIIEKQTR
jgi:hypothetical protein